MSLLDSRTSGVTLGGSGSTNVDLIAGDECRGHPPMCGSVYEDASEGELEYDHGDGNFITYLRISERSVDVGTDE